MSSTEMTRWWNLMSFALVIAALFFPCLAAAGWGDWFGIVESDSTTVPSSSFTVDETDEYVPTSTNDFLVTADTTKQDFFETSEDRKKSFSTSSDGTMLSSSSSTVDHTSEYVQIITESTLAKDTTEEDLFEEHKKRFRTSSDGTALDLSSSTDLTYRYVPTTTESTKVALRKSTHDEPEQDSFRTTEKRKELHNIPDGTTTEETEASSVIKDPLQPIPFPDDVNQKTRNEHVFSLSVDKIGAHKLLGVHDMGLPLCDDPVSINFIDLKTVTYALCISRKRWQKPAQITIGAITSKRWEKQEILLNLTLPSGIASFVLDGKLFFVVADQFKAEGNELVEYDPVKNSTKIHKPPIGSRYATAITVWKMVSDNSYYLAIASSSGENATNFRNSTFIYNWTKTYFDHSYNIATYDVRDLEPFRIGSHSYLAVANYRDAKDRYIVDSEIFKFDFDSRKFTSFQQIRTYGAMDWEFFSFGEDPNREYFLGLANQLDHYKTDPFVAKSVIYKFVNGEFSLFQCLETVGASRIASFQGDNGEFLLAISNQYDALNLYQYDGWHFVPSEVQHTQGVTSVGIVSLATHVINDGKHAVLAVANSEEGSAVFELEFEHENKMEAWRKESIKWCGKMKEIASEYNTEEMAKQLKNLYFVDQEESITIEGEMALEELYAETLTTSRIEEGGDVYEYKPNLDIKDRISTIRNKMDYIEETLQNALTGIDGQITGNYTFDEITLECGQWEHCSVNSIEADTLNGDIISNLFNEVVFVDENQILAEPLKVSEIRTKDIVVFGTIDGLHTSDLVTLSGDHIITVKKSLNSVEAQNISVSGTVDGIKVLRDNFLLTNGDQTITGNLMFEKVTTSDLTVGGLVDGVNLTKFYQEVVLRDGNYIINGSKSFSEIEVDNMFMAENTMNGIDLEGLWNNVLWTDVSQTISVPAVFGSATLKKDVYSEQTINGVFIPDDVCLTDQNIVLNSVKRFSDVTTIADLHIRNSINGIGMVLQNSGTPELDILLRTGDQTITGIKTFKSAHLEKDAHVKGLINEINVKTFRDDVANFRKEQINGTVKFRNVIVRNFMDDGLTEKQNRLLNNALKLTDEFLDATFVFKSDLNIADLNCSDINGLEMPKDFVLKRGNQVVHGKKTFKRLEVHANAIVEGLVNGMDLSFLDDTLKVKGDQFISGHKYIEGHLAVDSLKVKGLLNDVPLNDVVFISPDTVVHDTLIFESLSFQSNLTVHSLVVEGTLNRIDMNEFLDNSLTYSGSQTITGTKTISGNLIIVEGGNLNTDSINGIDISAVYKDSVLLKLHQTINGTKTFKSNATFNSVNFRGNFNGITDWDMRENWMLQGMCQTINGFVIFKKSVHFKGKVQIGSLNGKDIVELSSTIVRTNDTSIFGDFIFEKVKSFDVELSGRVNGIDISKDLILNTEKTVSLTGKKNFSSGYIVQGNVRLSGLINGVSIEDFCDAIVKDEESIGRLTVLGTVTFMSNLNVKGLLNELNLTEVYEDTWTNVEYTHFDVLVVERPIFVEGLVSGIDIVTLNNTYLSLTRNQTVYGVLVFQDKVTITGSLKTENIQVKGKIDGVNIDHLASSILKTTGDQMVISPVLFEDGISVQDIIVYGKVNQLRFPQDLVLKNRYGDVYMNGIKIFLSDVVVTENVYLDVGATVQSVDISEWKQHSVLIDGNGTEIIGVKIFSHLTVEDVWISGLLDNVNISDCPTSVRIKSVTDVRRLSGNITVELLRVEGLVNGVSIEQLAETTLRTNKHNVLVNAVNFTSPVFVTNLIVNGMVNDFNLRELDTEFSVMYENMTRHDMTIRRLQEIVGDQAIMLLYYQKVQTVREPRPHLIIGAKICNMDKLIVSNIPSCDNCSSVSLYDWDPKRGYFVKSNQDPLLTSGSVDIEVVNYKGDTLIVVANLNRNKCSNKESQRKLNAAAQIFIWNNTTNTFNDFQDIPMGPAIDVEAFVIEDTLCLIFCQIFEPARVETYCTNNLTKRFWLNQTIEGKIPRKVSVTHYGNVTYLAIAKTSSSEENYPECSVEVYEWNGVKFILSQTVSTRNAVTVLFVPYVTKDESHLFLVVGQNNIHDTGYVPPLTIYRYDEPLGYFTLYQKIGVHAVVSLDSLLLTSNGDLLLFVLTENSSGNLKVYRHQGASKFTSEHTLTFKGGKSLHVFQQTTGNHFVALAKNTKETCHPKTNTSGVTGIILKSKMKGNLAFV